jgi:hypothetical protein
VLEFDTVTDVPQWRISSFFHAFQNAKYLESIKLSEVIKGDAVIESFSNWITSTQSLKILKVSCCSGITSVGWQTFATALASLDNLEEIDIKNIGYDHSGTRMFLINVITQSKP